QLEAASAAAAAAAGSGGVRASSAATAPSSLLPISSAALESASSVSGRLPVSTAALEAVGAATVPSFVPQAPASAMPSTPPPHYPHQQQQQPGYQNGNTGRQGASQDQQQQQPQWHQDAAAQPLSMSVPPPTLPSSPLPTTAFHQSVPTTQPTTAAHITPAATAYVMPVMPMQAAGPPPPFHAGDLAAGYGALYGTPSSLPPTPRSDSFQPAPREASISGAPATTASAATSGSLLRAPSLDTSVAA
ncbi:hypothetical protein Agub_g3294, partial [Astrephomene gubernaculifera]